MVEVTRVARTHQALAGRVLAHSLDEAEITCVAVRAREKYRDAHLWTFYTGARIPEGVIFIPGFFEVQASGARDSMAKRS